MTNKLPDWAVKKAKDIVRKHFLFGTPYHKSEDSMAQALFDAVKDEREACAKVAEDRWDLRHSTKARIQEDIASAIRSRGDQT